MAAEDEVKPVVDIMTALRESIAAAKDDAKPMERATGEEEEAEVAAAGNKKTAASKKKAATKKKPAAKKKAASGRTKVKARAKSKAA